MFRGRVWIVRTCQNHSVKNIRKVSSYEVGTFMSSEPTQTIWPRFQYRSLVIKCYGSLFEDHHRIGFLAVLGEGCGIVLPLFLG